MFDPIFDRPGRIAVRALHGGSDSLRDLRFGERVGIEPLDGAIVNADKAGSKNQAASVNRSFAGCGHELADADDVTAVNAERAFAEWPTRTVSELRDRKSTRL